MGRYLIRKCQGTKRRKCGHTFATLLTMDGVQPYPELCRCCQDRARKRGASA